MFSNTITPPAFWIHDPVRQKEKRHRSQIAYLGMTVFALFYLTIAFAPAFFEPAVIPVLWLIPQVVGSLAVILYLMHVQLIQRDDYIAPERRAATVR